MKQPYNYKPQGRQLTEEEVWKLFFQWTKEGQEKRKAEEQEREEKAQRNVRKIEKERNLTLF